MNNISLLSSMSCLFRFVSIKLTLVNIQSYNRWYQLLDDFCKEGKLNNLLFNGS